MSAQKKWGITVLAAMSLAAAGCSSQMSNAEPSDPGTATEEAETPPAPLSTTAMPTGQAPDAQAPQELPWSAPVVSNAVAQPGWPKEGACRAGAQQLNAMFPNAPAWSGDDSTPAQPGGTAQPGAFGCTYGASGGVAPGASFSELYVDPAQKPDLIKVCDRQHKALQWSVIAYAPALDNGWAAYGLPQLREGQIQSALCGSTFEISVTLTDIPGATYQNALDLAMAMVNH